MRTLLITLALGLGLTACETHNDTYNYTCNCKCEMGTCMIPPSDTICVKTDADSVIVETEQVEEGN